MTDPTSPPRATSGPARDTGPDVCQVPDAYGQPVCVRPAHRLPCDTCPHWPDPAPPAELDAVAAGLDPEQESRADALAAAARLLAPALAGMSLPAVEANLDTIARVWVELAYHGDAWIADGHRPVDDDERDDRRRP